MKEEIKNICFFMICGQTLLHFQSGKKYEKICRMILDLLILVGIVGIVLNLLQSMGIRDGAMTAEGGAVSNMQRSMEEALSKQLDMELDEGEFLQGFSDGNLQGASEKDGQEFSMGTMEELAEKYTLNELKAKYQYLAARHGLEMERIERNGEGIIAYVRGSSDAAANEDSYFYGEKEDLDSNGESGADIGISDIQIAEIRVEAGENEGENEESEETGKNTETEKAEKAGEAEETGTAAKGEEEERLKVFRSELAEVLLMEEDRLEVVLIDGYNPE